jgi:hypothetical protein
MRNLISGSKPKKQKASSPPRGRQGTQDGPVLRADARSLDDEDEDDDQRGEGTCWLSLQARQESGNTAVSKHA